mgnify:FL=1
MKFQHVSRVVAFLSTLIFVSAIGSSLANADEAPAFSRRLPDSVAAHVAIPDAQVLRERLPNCSWGRLLNDPLVADFRANLVGEIRASIDASIRLPDGVSAEDLLNLNVGEITLTVLKPIDGNLPVVFSVNAAGAADTISKLVSESVNASESQGWAKFVVEHAGTSITVLAGGTDAAAGDTSTGNVRAVFQRDGFVVVGNSVETLKQVLDRWSGSVQGAFAANSTLNQIQQVTMKPGREPALFWYLDPVGAAVSLLSQGAASNPTASMALSRLPKLGLTSFRGVGGTIDFATGVHDTVTRIAGVVKQPVSAAMALVQFPPAKLTPPEWVPNDVDSFMMLNWDPQTAYSGAEEMADEFLGPGGLVNALQVLSTKTDPPIHLKNDILDGITGEVMILQGKTGASVARKNATLLAVNLKDPKKFEGIVRQLIEHSRDEIAVRDSTAGQSTGSCLRNS